MSTLIEAYAEVSKKIIDINEKIRITEDQITKLSDSFTGDASIRIQKLEEQLAKIDDYLLKIKGFEELAKRNLDSQNVLTIEAPEGYRVNLNRLRNWAMMIDPSSSNDPYAQRVYLVAKCDECFLEKKQKEFTERVEKLKEDQRNGTSIEIEALKKKSAEYRNNLRLFATSEQMSDFAKDVLAENKRYWHKKTPVKFENNKTIPEIISPGAYSASLNFAKEQRAWLKTILGDYYNEVSGRVLMPFELSNTHEYIMTINCAPGKRKKLDAALQNLVLNTINENPAGTRKVYVLDAVRYNSSSMGSLRKLEGTYPLQQIPRNPEQLTSSLEQIVSTFADTDEVLELHDSVSEYNNIESVEKQIPYTTVIVFGWPNSFEGKDRELLRRILMNYERYGVSVITVAYRNVDQLDEDDEKFMPEYAAQNAIHVDMTQVNDAIISPAGKREDFSWYLFEDEISDNYAESVNEMKIDKDVIGNEYIKRYSLTDIPQYTRAYKKIELPFGIDGKDQAHSLSFENENFAAYLVGASRSGKSTMLHTLIAGLIRNYHPDNVELWLADFKQLEFKRYIKHLPPHVKYVLLDESTELVYNLLDKLTEEMMERQKLFSRLGVQRIDQIDTTVLEKPLPVIFVILDEFSIMSQSIAEDNVYQLKLQNILAKGAALGIKFLFSSQTFTTGVSGLTSTARAQIQQRIAMKSAKDEIVETLELSANLKTEQVQNWMDALPPHYALVKFRAGADTMPQVKRFLVMYFKDYALRDEMIDYLNNSMHSVEEYDPKDIHSYMDKHPVLVDGNTFDAFPKEDLLSGIKELKENEKQDFSGEEMFLSLGTPRLMTKMRMTTLSSETRENILLLSRGAEQACAASILLSAAKSYKLQNGDVEIWAYSKNRLYKSYKNLLITIGAEAILDLDNICDAIKLLKKKIMNKEAGNKLILLVGMDRICTDFEFVDTNPSAAVSSGSALQTMQASFVKSGAVASDEEDEQNRKLAFAWMRKKDELIEKAKAEKKTEDETKQLLSDAYSELKKSYIVKVSPQVEDNENKGSVSSESESQAGAYNALEDFVYVIKQGSRLGYHFMLNLNDYSEIKHCGLRQEFFRYHMSFQLSAEDSRNFFNTRIASTLPEHICEFDDSLEKYSLRPYLHKGIGWEGWSIDEQGNVINPYAETDE
jgi:DNA segregation ATPase FtsK/SpoIIIE and related proteins